MFLRKFYRIMVDIQCFAHKYSEFVATEQKHLEKYFLIANR